MTDEADGRLGHYLPLPEDLQLPPGVEIPPRPQLAEGVIDAPLVRVYNFLRESFASSLASDDVAKLTVSAEIMSMSYQLEILCYQVNDLFPCGCVAKTAETDTVSLTFAG